MKHSNQPPFFSVGSSSGNSFVQVRASRRTIFNTLAALGAVALLVAGAWWAARTILAKPTGSIGTYFALADGPWGKITAQPILIEAPEKLLSTDFQLGDSRWYFAARSATEVASFLRAAGVDEMAIAKLVSLVGEVDGKAGLWSVRPPEDIVRGLSPAVRSVLYDQLAAIPENFAQVEPFRTTQLYLEKWLEAEKLPADLITEVKSLIWKRGSGLFFSDYNLVADHISSPALKIEFLRQLTQKASVVLTLYVPAGDSIDDLVAYYGVNGRADKVRPILQGLSEAGGGMLGVSNMLPPFARSRLYRFPDALPGSDLGPACHWTSFNFFNQGAPDNSLHEVPAVQDVLGEKYCQVTGPPRFGDVVLLRLPDNSSIHSAVYIADNIVFTKNGPSLATPYIFSTIEEMLAFYPNSESIRLAYYRLKDS
jgi:hypothetical protein